MKTDIDRVIELAEKLADRFERIGLDENGNMDKADKRLLERLREVVRQYRANATKGRKVKP
jgi:hypothetical protein